jgi:hypothetical protein
VFADVPSLLAGDAADAVGNGTPRLLGCLQQVFLAIQVVRMFQEHGTYVVVAFRRSGHYSPLYGVGSVYSISEN